MITDIAERKITAASSKDQLLFSGWVLVRVDQRERLPSVVSHAMAIAAGLRRRIRLFEVLDPGMAPIARIDPVDWDIRKRETQLHLECLAKIYSRTDLPIDIQVLEHALPSDIGHCDSAEPPILAFGRHKSELPWHLDEANRNLLENQCNSILMVPDGSKPQVQISYKRLVVPLDGSSRAEAALPAAIAIARCHDAQLSLVHVTPRTTLTRNGPLSAEDRDLENLLASRNDRVAREYLKVLRDKCSSSGVSVKTHVMNDGDARRELLDIAYSMDADLIILNSHGSSGYGDVLSGSVATYILEHARLPVLMMGQRAPGTREHLFSGASAPGIRQPGYPVSAV